MTRALIFTMNEKTVISTDMKSILAILAAVAGGVWAWSSLKADVADHSRQLTVIQATLGADHDQLKVQGTILDSQSRLLERMDRKLDYATGASSIRPAPSTHGTP